MEQCYRYLAKLESVHLYIYGAGTSATWLSYSQYVFVISEKFGKRKIWQTIDSGTKLLEEL